jgi:hypothetical protein
MGPNPLRGFWDTLPCQLGLHGGRQSCHRDGNAIGSGPPNGRLRYSYAKRFTPIDQMCRSTYLFGALEGDREATRSDEAAF